MIRVKFFASLRELVHKKEASIAPQTKLTVMQVWQLATDKTPIPNNTLCAINLEYTDLGSAVKDNDEVAFFPPVTGG